MSDDSEAERNEATQSAAVQTLPTLRRLKTLVLKDYGKMEVTT